MGIKQTMAADAKRMAERANFRANRYRDAIEHLRAAGGALEEIRNEKRARNGGLAGSAARIERNRIADLTNRLLDRFEGAALIAGWDEMDIRATKEGR